MGITKKCRERQEFIKNVIVEDYLHSNLTLRELEKKYHCERRSITKILKQLNIRIRNRYHDVELKNYFDSIDSEEAAYWFGFLFADGTITYNGKADCIRYAVELGLCEKDLQHIMKFCSFLGVSENRIHRRESSKSYRVMVYSKRLCTNLYNMGLVNNKTYNADINVILQNVPDNFLKDFLRGYFDGDGHFGNGISIGFTSLYKETVIKILEKFNIFESNVRVVQKQNTKAVSVLLKKKDSARLLFTMYNGSKIYLDRKYEKYVNKLPSVLETIQIITGQKR